MRLRGGIFRAENMLSQSLLFVIKLPAWQGGEEDLINPIREGVPVIDWALTSCLCSRNWGGADGKAGVPDTHQCTRASQRPLEEWRCCTNLQKLPFVFWLYFPELIYPTLLLLFSKCDYCRFLLKSILRFGLGFRVQLSLMLYRLEKVLHL